MARQMAAAALGRRIATWLALTRRLLWDGHDARL
jgi:hypothetical protein